MDERLINWELKMTTENKEIITAYKGFDNDLKCRGYSFEIGKEHIHEGKVEACKSGFHSCEYPLDVFSYYVPADSRFCLVEVSGDLSRHSEDSKIASASLTIKAELKIPELVSAAIKFIMNNVKKDNKKSAHKTEEKSHASNTGDYSAASNTGNRSAASNTGNRSAASVTGKNSVALASGYQSKALASEGSAIVLCYRDNDYNLIHIKAGIAGKDIKADTWYTLDKDGEFEACGNE